jgi:hypothetical protein
MGEPLSNQNPDQNTKYQCAVCKKWHPVVILARDCEKKHES